jgi:PhnB protein
VTFIKQVFGGRGDFRRGLPAEGRIGESVVMVSAGGGIREPAPGFLYIYVEDADATYQRALAAKAVPLEKPADMPPTGIGSRR